jgi:hypothetical protein
VKAEKRMKRVLVPGTVLLLLGAAWLYRGELLRLVPTSLLPLPAHDQYAAALVLTGLSTSEAGRAWSGAAKAALVHPAEAALQHHRRAAFTGASGEVLAWHFAARRGQRVIIEARDAPHTIFLDLFDMEDRARVASAPPHSARLSHVLGHDGEHIVRLQLPLDSRGTFTIAQRAEASLRFPVQGLDSHAVQSRFGVARDSGGRSHEGIDIFAPRGTSVIAAADGWITPQTSNRLGGNVVWLWASGAGASLYYAHLDRRAVRPGDRVRAGDVVGHVGNTGNARATAPHLHFGIYTPIDGAVDPLPYVVDPSTPR